MVLKKIVQTKNIRFTCCHKWEAYTTMVKNKNDILTNEKVKNSNLMKKSNVIRDSLFRSSF